MVCDIFFLRRDDDRALIAKMLLILAFYQRCFAIKRCSGLYQPFIEIGCNEIQLCFRRIILMTHRSDAEKIRHPELMRHRPAIAEIRRIRIGHRVIHTARHTVPQKEALRPPCGKEGQRSLRTFFKGYILWHRHAPDAFEIQRLRCQRGHRQQGCHEKSGANAFPHLHISRSSWRASPRYHADLRCGCRPDDLPCCPCR